MLALRSIIRDCLYLFGGSGHTTRCFNDVHVYETFRKRKQSCSPVGGHCSEGHFLEFDGFRCFFKENRHLKNKEAAGSW